MNINAKTKSNVSLIKQLSNPNSQRPAIISKNYQNYRIKNQLKKESHHKNHNSTFEHNFITDAKQVYIMLT